MPAAASERLSVHDLHIQNTQARAIRRRHPLTPPYPPPATEVRQDLIAGEVQLHGAADVGVGMARHRTVGAAMGRLNAQSSAANPRLVGGLGRDSAAKTHSFRAVEARWLPTPLAVVVLHELDGPPSSSVDITKGGTVRHTDASATSAVAVGRRTEGFRRLQAARAHRLVDNVVGARPAAGEPVERSRVVIAIAHASIVSIGMHPRQTRVLPRHRPQPPPYPPPATDVRQDLLTGEVQLHGVADGGSGEARHRTVGAVSGRHKAQSSVTNPRHDGGLGHDSAAKTHSFRAVEAHWLPKPLVLVAHLEAEGPFVSSVAVPQVDVVEQVSVPRVRLLVSVVRRGGCIRESGVPRTSRRILAAMGALLAAGESVGPLSIGPSVTKAVVHGSSTPPPEASVLLC